MSEEAHGAAVVAALRAQGSAAYDLGELAKLPVKPAHYNEVHITERYPLGTDDRYDGTTETRYWRALIRSVGQQYVNAQRERDKASALVGSYLTVSGRTSTQLDLGASTDPIAPDDGWFSGVIELIYAI